MKIYVASSWRNPYQADIVARLRAAGFEVYDFKNPGPGNTGFKWSEIDPNWHEWTPEQRRDALDHPVARAGFKADMDALTACDACVLVLPCGKSAHLELGWAVGAGKFTLALAYGAAGAHEAELMYAMLSRPIQVSLGDLIAELKAEEATMQEPINVALAPGPHKL